MRFLQFFNVYPQALQDIYNRWPHLHFSPHQEQVAALQIFGFCSGYMYAPYMQPHGYEPIAIFPNDAISQSQWARENGIALSDPNQWLQEVAAKQIDYYKPDILFFSEPIRLDSKFLRAITHKPKLICGWRAAPIPQGTDWSSFDIIFSNLSALREIAPRLGAKRAQHFWPGFERRITELVKAVPIQSDLVFCGQWTSEHIERNKLIAGLADGIENNSLGFACALNISGESRHLPANVSKHNQGMKFGIEYYAALKSGAMDLDARGTILTFIDPTTGREVDLFQGETGTNRMLEVTGVGSLLMAEHYDNLKRYFEFDSEIVTFTCFDDLLEKVRYLKSNPQLLSEIAAKGHARCMREHSMEVRAAELHEILSKALRERSVGANSQSKEAVHGDPKSNMTRAILAHQSGDTQAAISILTPLVANGAPREANFLLGLCLARLSRYKEAIFALNTEVNLYPDNLDAKNLSMQLQRLNAQLSSERAL